MHEDPKYSLENLLGHQSLRNQLLQLHQRDRMPHAMLFSGPEGVGKRTTAIALASLLLSRTSQRSDNNAAKLIRSGTHPDLHLLRKETEKRDLGVESIRGLTSALQLKPYCGVGIVAVIDNAHQMTIAASNALLTTLEEPTEGSFLILISDTPHRLPATILSRCQAFNFGLLSHDDAQSLRTQVFGDILSEHTKLLDSLGKLSSESLGGLGLDAFLDSKTSRVLKPKELIRHLESLVQQTESLHSEIRHILEDGTSADAVIFATDAASEKESIPLVWKILQQEIRQKISRVSNLKEKEFWANILLETLQRESLSKERTLSPAIHLSGLLAKATSQLTS